MKTFTPIFLSVLLVAISAGCGPVTPQPPAQKLQDFAYQLAWSPDDQWLAASSETGLFLINAKTHKQVAAFPEAKGSDIVFGTQLMAANNGQTIRVWDLKDNHQVFATTVSNSNIQSIAISRDDTLLVTGEQKRFRLWSLLDGALLAEIPVDGFVSNVTFTPDNHLIVILQYKAIIQTWDVQTQKMLHSFEIPRDVIFFTLGRDGETALLDFNDFGFERWDILTGKLLSKHEKAIGASGFTRLSGDSRFAVVWAKITDGKSTMSVWDLPKDHRTFEVYVDMVNGDGWRCGALSADGAMLAASDNEGFIFFYNVATGEKTGEFYLPYVFELR